MNRLEAAFADFSRITGLAMIGGAGIGVWLRDHATTLLYVGTAAGGFGLELVGFLVKRRLAEAQRRLVEAQIARLNATCPRCDGFDVREARGE